MNFPLRRLKRNVAIFVPSFVTFLTCGVLVFVLLTSPASGQTETLLYSFSGSTDGTSPLYSLIQDASGNLYGVTFSGGANNGGTAFELSPQPGGGWSLTTLHSFGGTGDGFGPSGRLVMDNVGNLYGVTSGGGANGAGTAYELTQSGGVWSEAVIYSFRPLANSPFGGLVMDAAGNLYGTTMSGGSKDCAGGCGTVFELSLTGGQWTQTILYHFLGLTKKDGAEPNGDLIFDGAGNLYGTTYLGGAYGGPIGNGTIFKLSPAKKGWIEKVLYSFHGTSDGQYPGVGLTFDASGNLYGTTWAGGTVNDSCALNGTCGVVFELIPKGKKWTEKVLYSFSGGSDGANPQSIITINGGRLYGTTSFGGNQPGTAGAGLVFVLSSSGGKWTQSLAHTFAGSPDGAQPIGGVILDQSGIIYGTATTGGSQGAGVIYEISQ